MTKEIESIEKAKKEILEAEKNNDYSKINSVLCNKRLSWLEKRINDYPELNELEKAYRLLLIDKMGLDEKEVPIVFQDEKKIIWRSYNLCPTLVACKELGLDTRKVCREGYEESVDKFVKKINPKLKFFRNYETLRPHGEYCEEMITFE